MCYSLYFAIIQHECGFNQSLTIACGAGAHDCCIIRKQRVNLLNRADCSFERAAVIITVERIQQSTIFIYQSYFGSGRSGINTQIAISLIGCQISGYHMVAAVSGSKNIIGFFIFKQRIKTFHLKFHLNIYRKFIHHFLHGVKHIILCVQRRADGSKKMRVVRLDHMFLIQLQCADKGCAQFG